jgi:hypothetical protein
MVAARIRVAPSDLSVVVGLVQVQVAAVFGIVEHFACLGKDAGR